MKRSDFLKTLGLGAGSIIIPSNSFIETKAIKVYDNYVRGITHYQFSKVQSAIKEGDILTLKRDKKNQYDSFAVQIYWNEHKMGYIAAYENIVLANMLDAGVNLKAFVSYVDNNATNIYSSLALEIFAELIIPTAKLIDSLLLENRADNAPDTYRNLNW